MKLGLKVNADTESFERLEGANPPFVEVWFNVNNAGTYTDLFANLARRKCEAGLHFWGVCEGNIAPNIAYPDTSIINQTKLLMRQTIDIAAANRFSYVNIHPGASALSKVNYSNQRCDLVNKPVDTETSIQLFLENARILSEYAKSRAIIFTVETVPPRITDGWYNESARLTAKNIYELPDTAIVRAADAGLWVANDFCHTAANCISADPQAVWSHLLSVTQKLRTQTRLIHIGFVMPPYNGSDNHDMLDNPILNSDAAVPNKKQMIELLKLFQNHADIRILAEPKEDHVKNYFLVQNLLDEALKI